MFATCIALASAIGALAVAATGQTAADPAGPTQRWVFNAAAVQGGTLTAAIGRSGQIKGEPTLGADEGGDFLRFSGEGDWIILADDAASAPELRPAGPFTVEAVVSVHAPQEWGGIIGAIQDNGDFEKGWLLGYDQRGFYLGISTLGAADQARDSDGVLTYLRGKTAYEPGKWYHVAAVYDGQETRLYVNGVLDASTREQSGPILHPPKARAVIGCYLDDDERFPLDGRVAEVAMFDRPLSDAEIAARFEPVRARTLLPSAVRGPAAFVVNPYLTWATTDAVSVLWETESASSGYVTFGPRVPLKERAESRDEKTIHEVRLSGLEPGTTYYYRVSVLGADGVPSEGPLGSFQTAPADDRAYGFVVIGDTQATPRALEAVSNLAFAERPSFFVLAGDLVTTGRDKSHWTGHFFPNIGPFIARVPMFPVLGNHEQNADWYYRYMSLPEPEYYYSFRWGNSAWFMLDSNKPLGPGSEQYEWLDRELAADRSTWRFCVLHHPAYSSDENDYGNTWRDGVGRQGEINVRQIVPLFEKHKVDVVFNGHIHLYERTWPVRESRVDQHAGVVYLTTGGGGGGLEAFAPTRTWFSRVLRVDHHLVSATIHGGRAEFRAIDQQGRLFDTFTLEKPVPHQTADADDTP